MSDLVLPALVARHQDPIVKRMIPRAQRLFERRGDLRGEYRTALGETILPPCPEFLARPPRRDGAPAPDYERRRADGMEAILRVLLTLIACCDWRTMEIFDPDSRHGKYLSVARLAELAELPVVLEKDEDGREYRDAGDRTERALRSLRAAGVVCFTQQHREELADGRHVSTGAALRKLAVGFFLKMGGAVKDIFDKRRAKLKRRHERRKERAAAGGAGADLRFRSAVRDAVNATPAPLEAAPTIPVRGQPPVAIADQVFAEHPDWGMAAILEEARKRAGPDSS